jgi:hypothetical protein
MQIKGETEMRDEKMLTKKAKWTVTVIVAIIVLNSISPVLASTNNPTIADSEVNAQVEAVVPVSIEMVDEAIEVLAGGLSNLSPEQAEAFLRLYDPSKSGEVDEKFASTVVNNYKKIRRALDGNINAVYEPDSDMCEGKRLYYTDLLKIHVCPYFNGEDNMDRKARVLVHEMAHKALLVTDRHYFRPTSKAYLTLTPNGSWAAQLPIVGKIFREIAHNDTLYHPDAYAHFAVAVYTGDYEKISG